MRVSVDLELCEGNGRCVATAPEVFALDESDKARLLDPAPGPALRDKVLLAARLCPRQAITVVDDQ